MPDTAPTEPLKTTSEEIVAEQERLELWVCLACRQTWLDDTSLIPSGGGYGHSLGFDLCGEVVEVNAARDDAADLRAALLRWHAAVEAEQDAFHNAEQDDGPSAAWMHHDAAHRELRTAESHLLSLAAALAATEGSEP